MGPSYCPWGPAAEGRTESEGRGSACAWLWGSGDGLHMLVIHYLLFIGLIGFGHFLIVSCPERRL